MDSETDDDVNSQGMNLPVWDCWREVGHKSTLGARIAILLAHARVAVRGFQGIDANR